MANILYYSVHEILEFDELNILYDLGHNVFTLGTFLQVGQEQNHWRPIPNFRSGVKELVESYIASQKVLTEEFLSNFSIVIVMHDLDFIISHWRLIKDKKVIWRTIGQSIHEEIARPYQQEGLLIVGWSKREELNPNFIGRDAIIYACKDPALYGPWTGAEGGVLTFSNAYGQRYPQELQFFLDATRDLPVKLGGGMNEDIPNSIGLVEFAAQAKMYAGCGVYFYAHGTNIPYTLNFIEALMSGAPIVAIGPGAELHGYDLRYNEIFYLLEHEKSGYFADTPVEANSLMKSILAEPRSMVEVSKAARKLAIEKFGPAEALRSWGNILGKGDTQP